MLVQAAALALMPVREQKVMTMLIQTVQLLLILFTDVANHFAEGNIGAGSCIGDRSCQFSEGVLLPVVNYAFAFNYIE